MEENGVTYVKFYNQRNDITIEIPVLGINNEFLNVEERRAAYDRLADYLAEEAISDFVISEAYKKPFKKSVEYYYSHDLESEEDEKYQYLK